MEIPRESTTDVSIGMEDPHASLLLTSMKSRLENLSPVSSERCIYRVPKRIRDVNHNAYTPRLVSIGPFHHGKPGLKAMEEHKWRHLQNFLRQTRVKLDDLVKFIKDREERARNCYAETIALTSDEFVQILIVDATFTIDILLGKVIPQLTCAIECVYDRSSLMFDIYRDMLLIENQLPYFILGDILDFAKSIAASGSSQWPSILELTRVYFNSYMQLGRASHPMRRSEVNHFVDFLRLCHQPIKPRQTPRENRKFEMTRSSTELREAGVKFKVASTTHLLDIQFNDGVLEIPYIRVSEITEAFFRNLIAFEQCHCHTSYISDYIVIMDSLINTPHDVEVLVKYGIMKVMLANNVEASTLFNNLAKEILYDSHVFYYSLLCEDLNTFCKVRWHRWKATLKHNYFNTPWTAISVIAGVILLVLTFIQAVCSIIQVSGSKLA
ncbi:UPF0481 protein At3g47200 [Ricinus communis]|uniref:Uncharacterized protein n=1 Tax=Ricinus communis TaxID=3988 RepID=B9RP75_RICCO|nr:UPF0481 protein At3g47200 [Ricinus communis]EEF46993.1 conserved hypothetical protein [Ricinus communis]|eukprot:XP_002515544.1 UPF0481 protein At3g47200 [Ricinus communis]